MSLFLQTLVLRGILFREQEHRQERISVGMTLWPTGAQTPPSRYPALRTDSPKNEDKMKRTIVIPALLLLAASATAQTTFAQTKDPVGAALRNILPGRQKNTVAAVEAMPADKFNYKPSADQMTFGHLVAHMVETNYAVCSGAAAVTAPKVEEVKETDTKDKLVAALKASFDFCADALSKMDDSKLGEMIAGMGPQPLSRARFALGIASNWADHYAEAAMYLRLNGILPPTAKK